MLCGLASAPECKQQSGMCCLYRFARPCLSKGTCRCIDSRSSHRVCETCLLFDCMLEIYMRGDDLESGFHKMRQREGKLGDLVKI